MSASPMKSNGITVTTKSAMTTFELCSKTLLSSGVVAAILLTSACAPSVVKNPAAERVRADFVALQADPNLANQAPAAMLAADKAVRIAQMKERDANLVAHRVYLADGKVKTARALSQAQYAVSQRSDLSEEGNAVRLAARTREADMARNQAQLSAQEASSSKMDAERARNEADSANNDAYMARTDADIAKNEANAARSAAQIAQDEAGVSRNAAATARGEADSAMAQTAIAQGETNAALDAADAARASANSANQQLLIVLADLQAKNTERGVQLTLGDVLFSTGKADLKAGTAAKLDKLVSALNGAPGRRIVIEGFTDSVGSDAMNMTLSQQRADTVSRYLSSHGVNATRITANGKGESFPVAGNENAQGRQLNRRVEVTIENPSSAMN